jgi:cellulose synthase/poly-beta-1,6-N-acetylglucosamine synthase-like glycosyltransferase
MRIYDLISEGSRDYALESSGPIEETAWAIDETALYYISREAPPLPLELRSEVPYQIDTRSANLLLWELNLVTGGVSLLADLGEAFGASSMAVTDDYIFVVLVESNARLIEDLNRGALAYNLAPEDPLWNTYIPRRLRWRVERAGGGAGVIDEGVWSVVARPR